MSRDIRISSGWGFVSSFDSSDFQTLSDMANGLELSVTSPERLSFFDNTGLNTETASVHLPTLPDTQTNWYYKLKSQYPIETVVVHATENTQSFEKINGEIGTPPLSFENLDGSSGREDVGFCGLRNEDVFFTIDVQHLVENGTVGQAKQIIDELAMRIQQFHVSGGSNSGPSHELVYTAGNQDAITQLLTHISDHPIVSNRPWVVEGKYNTLSDVEEELEFLRKF
jgi:hypothetical protein